MLVKAQHVQQDAQIKQDFALKKLQDSKQQLQLKIDATKYQQVDSEKQLGECWDELEQNRIYTAQIEKENEWLRDHIKEIKFKNEIGGYQ